MRYTTWKLNFPSPDYGYGPETIANTTETILEASNWVNGDIILGYLQGDLNLANFAAYELTEISHEEAIVFAQQLNPDAFINESGYIVTALP